MEKIKKYTCKCKSCNREFDEKEYLITQDENKCILHCEKDDWYEVDDNGNKNWDKSKRNINLFWKKIQEYLDKKYEESFYEPEVINDIYIYDNVVFPKFQEDVPHNKYEDNQVELGTNFYSYFYTDEGGYREELNTIISELNVSFKNCKFLDNVELSRYNFTKDLDFERCEFKKNLTLKKMIIKGNIELYDVKINGKLDLSETIFKDSSKVRIKNCEIRNADFHNSKFSNLVI